MFAQYIIANLGMSPSFGKIDFDHLTFPTTMRIDYIRVYQQSDRVNIGCSPDNFPTADYIARSVVVLVPRCVLVPDLSRLKISRGVRQPFVDDVAG